MSDQYFSPTTGIPETPVYELSGWWRRVGALMIDSLLLSIPIVIVGVVAAFSLVGSDVESAEDFGLDSGIVILLIFVGAIALPALYYCWIMPRTNGQTWGKQATGIRVVREDGQKITAGFAFIREILVIGLLLNLIGGILLFNLPIFVDYLWPLWDSKNQALHDKIVKSRVVRVPEQAGVQLGAPTWQAGTPAAPPTAAPVPYVPPGQQYVAPQSPPTPQFPQQPAAPAAPSPAQPQTPPPPTAPPPPPPPSGTATPYTPPPEFENPVPDEEN